MFLLNTSRPLFRNNPKLRQAVNFAVDRRAIAREARALAEHADRPVPARPAQPGYRDARIYPLKGPDLRRASALAEGRTRGGKAVLYTSNNPIDVAQAQILQRNLKAIGLELEIVQFPAAPCSSRSWRRSAISSTSAASAGAISPDPAFSHIFDGRTIGQAREPELLLLRLAEVQPAARPGVAASPDRAVPSLRRARRPALAGRCPGDPLSRLNALAFVSPRVGCVVMNPALDLTAVCLK